MTTFSVGDKIMLKSSAFNGQGEIVALRHAIGNYRTGDLSFGADVLLSSGEVKFFYMHDLARWNPDKMKAAFT